MGLKNIYGHHLNIEILLSTLKTGKIGHAYLLSGPSGVGKKTVAKAFVEELFCLEKVDGLYACGKCRSCQKLLHDAHPDLYYIAPDGSRVKIDQMRQLQKTIFYKPYEAEYKAVIIEDADTMTTEAANSILKTLEEPPSHTVFFLITSKPHGLLPTIQSRCQKLNFSKLGVKEVEAFLVERLKVDSEKAAFFAMVADGNLQHAENLAVSNDILEVRNEIIEVIKVISKKDIVKTIKVINEWEKRKDQFPFLVDIAILFYRDFLVWKETGNLSLIINKDSIEFLEEAAGIYNSNKLIKIIEELEKLKRYLAQNVNFRVILDNLALILKPNHN